MLEAAVMCRPHYVILDPQLVRLVSSIKENLENVNGDKNK